MIVHILVRGLHKVCVLTIFAISRWRILWVISVTMTVCSWLFLVPINMVPAGDRNAALQYLLEREGLKAHPLGC